MIYDWPTLLLSPRVTDLRLINNTRSAGESITGFEQVVDGITQRWGLTLEFNNLKQGAILPYRALKAKLRGRANALRVPIRDPKLWPSDAAIGLIHQADRREQWAGSVVDGLIQSDVVAAISGFQGDKVAAVNLSSISEPADVLYPGHYFGAGEDLHIITDISWSGSVATITFEPSFRRDHTSSSFKLRPTVICRLVSDEVGNHPLERGIIMSPALDLVEVLPDELDAMEV